MGFHKPCKYIKIYYILYSGSINCWEFFRAAANPLASQEGLWSVQLVSWLFGWSVSQLVS